MKPTPGTPKMSGMLDKQINITSGAGFIRKGRKSPQNQADSLDEDDMGQGLRSGSSVKGGLERLTLRHGLFPSDSVGENAVSGKLSASAGQGLMNSHL